MLSFGFAFALDCVDSSKVNFILADKTKGSELLKEEDDFTNSLSEFDLSARLKTSRKVTKEEYLDFISRQTLDWDDVESLYLNVAFTEIKDLLKKYKIMLPKEPLETVEDFVGPVIQFLLIRTSNGEIKVGASFGTFRDVFYRLQPTFHHVRDHPTESLG